MQLKTEVNDLCYFLTGFKYGRHVFFPTSKFQMARIKLEILTHLSKVVFLYVFKWLEGSQLQNLSLSGTSFNSKWTGFTVYINIYSGADFTKGLKLSPFIG